MNEITHLSSQPPPSKNKGLRRHAAKFFVLSPRIVSWHFSKETWCPSRLGGKKGLRTSSEINLFQKSMERNSKRMKKGTLFSTMLVFALALTACGGTRPASNSNQGNGVPRQLPLATKLLIGTLKLEDTPNAVDAKQAETLLPLWQLYKSLNGSNTAAPQEIDSVVQQIQAAMTADQTKAIDGMNLTGRDIFTTMQELGLAPQANAQGTPFPRGGFGNGEGGPRFIPGGAGPGFAPGGGQNLNPQQIATAQARRTQGGLSANRVPTVLLDALIKLLESKGTPTPISTSIITSTPTEAITFTPALSTGTLSTATPTP